MTITTTPTLIIEASLAQSDFANTGTTTIFIARTAADCTPASGVPLAAGDVWSGSGPIFACVAADTGTAAVLPPHAI